MIRDYTKKEQECSCTEVAIMTLVDADDDGALEKDAPSTCCMIASRAQQLKSCSSIAS